VTTPSTASRLIRRLITSMTIGAFFCVWGQAAEGTHLGHAS
jgi:hypothetical protein